MHNRSNTLKKLGNISISVPILATLICLYGFMILYSTAGGSVYPWAYKQIIVFCIFMPISFLIAVTDLRLIFNLTYIFYFLVIFLLIFVSVAGKKAMGGTRWISLGGFNLQPSELAKLAVVLVLAKLFHNNRMHDINKLSNLAIPILAVLLPALLVIKQPDLGTGIVILLVASVMFFAAGLHIRYFIVIGVLIVASLPVLWYMLHDYQKNRVLIFIDPGKEPLGAGYNIIQSKIAIGSGGLFGKGLLSGTQSHLKFLPEYQTDFIFAVLSEELGFAGGMALLILYFLLIISLLSVAANCRSQFSQLTAIGIAAIFFSHVFINMAMTMGMLPVVGVPLPLISYGGTMMASILIGFGFVMNAEAHRNLPL